jgi:hypothetical protein
MRATRLAAAVAAAISAYGCGGVSPLVFNPKYHNADFSGRYLHVLPLAEVHVRNPDDFRDDFEREGATRETSPGPLLARLFQAGLSRYADHATLVFDSTSDTETLGLRDTLLQLPGESGPIDATFSFPPAGSLRDKGVEPDLCLQISNLHFQRSSQARHGHWVPTMVKTPGGSVPGGGMMVGGGNQQSLDLDGSFLIWDYRANEAVAYGRFSTSSQFAFAMTREDWQEAVSDAVLFIVKNSPLKGPKYAKATTATSSNPRFGN